jgi:hypothetical protein
MAIMVFLAVASSSALAGTVTIKIMKDCQGQYFKEIGSYQSETGKTFLVAGLNIDFAGSGSDTFYVDSSVFDVEVSGVRYPYSLASFSLGPLGLSPLKTTTLVNGGSTTGYLAFEVPEGTNKFEIKYVGDEDDIVNVPTC